MDNNQPINNLQKLLSSSKNQESNKDDNPKQGKQLTVLEQIKKDRAMARQVQLQIEQEIQTSDGNIMASRSLRRNQKPVYYGQSKTKKNDQFVAEQDYYLNQIFSDQKTNVNIPQKLLWGQQVANKIKISNNNLTQSKKSDNIIDHKNSTNLNKNIQTKTEQLQNSLISQLRKLSGKQPGFQNYNRGIIGAKKKTDPLLESLNKIQQEDEQKNSNVQIQNNVIKQSDSQRVVNNLQFSINKKQDQKTDINKKALLNIMKKQTKQITKNKTKNTKDPKDKQYTTKARLANKKANKILKRQSRDSTVTEEDVEVVKPKTNNKQVNKDVIGKGKHNQQKMDKQKAQSVPTKIQNTNAVKKDKNQCNQKQISEENNDVIIKDDSPQVDIFALNPLRSLIEQRKESIQSSNHGNQTYDDILRSFNGKKSNHEQSQPNMSHFQEKELERSFRRFLKILKFKHQKHVVTKQEKTTAEDNEEKERLEKEMNDALANQEARQILQDQQDQYQQNLQNQLENQVQNEIINQNQQIVNGQIMSQQPMNVNIENIEQQVYEEQMQEQQQQIAEMALSPYTKIVQIISQFIECKQKIQDFETIQFEQQEKVAQLTTQEIIMLNQEAEEANNLIEELTDQYVQAYQCIMKCVLDRFELQAENNMLRDQNNELKIVPISEEDPRIQELVEKNFFILELLHLVNTYVITEASQTLQNFQRNVKIFPPATIEDYCQMMINGPDEMKQFLINEQIIVDHQNVIPVEQEQQLQLQNQQSIQESPMQQTNSIMDQGIVPQESAEPQQIFDQDLKEQLSLENHLRENFSLTMDEFLYMENIQQQQQIIQGLSMTMKKALQDKIESMENAQQDIKKEEEQIQTPNIQLHEQNLQIEMSQSSPQQPKKTTDDFQNGSLKLEQQLNSEAPISNPMQQAQIPSNQETVQVRGKDGQIFQIPQTELNRVQSMMDQDGFQPQPVPQMVDGGEEQYLQQETQEFELIQDSDGQQWLCPITPNTGLGLRHVQIANRIQMMMSQGQMPIIQQMDQEGEMNEQQQEQLAQLVQSGQYQKLINEQSGVDQQHFMASQFQEYDQIITENGQILQVPRQQNQQQQPQDHQDTQQNLTLDFKQQPIQESMTQANIPKIDVNTQLSRQQSEQLPQERQNKNLQQMLQMGGFKPLPFNIQKVYQNPKQEAQQPLIQSTNQIPHMMQIESLNQSGQQQQQIPEQQVQPVQQFSIQQLQQKLSEQKTQTQPVNSMIQQNTMQIQNMQIQQDNGQQVVSMLPTILSTNQAVQKIKEQNFENQQIQQLQNWGQNSGQGQMIDKKQNGFLPSVAQIMQNSQRNQGPTRTLANKGQQQFQMAAQHLQLGSNVVRQGQAQAQPQIAQAGKQKKAQSFQIVSGLMNQQQNKQNKNMSNNRPSM